MPPLPPRTRCLLLAGNVAGLRALVGQEGVDVNEKDEEGRSALHFASGYDEIECMKVCAVGACVWWSGGSGGWDM